MRVQTFGDLNTIPVKYDHMVVHVYSEDKDYKYYADVPEWVEVTIPTQSGAATWGAITGDITNQIDLLNYLSTNYADINHTHPQLPPLAHTHVEIDITDLDKYTQAEVDALVAYKDSYTTGIIAGGTLTVNLDNTKFDISSGNMLFQEFDAQDPFVEAITHNVNFTSWTAVTPTYLGTHPATYVGITYTPGTQTYDLVQSSIPFSSTLRRTIAPIGVVYHGDNTTISRVINVKSTPITVGNQLEDLIRSIGSLNLSGNVITPNGANLSFDKSVGVIFGPGINYDVNSKTPHVKTLNASIAADFTYTTQTSVEALESPNIEPDFYDNGGTLTPLPTGKWTIQRFYMLSDGYFRAQYGQNIYDTKQDAVSVMESEAFVVEPTNLSEAILRAYLIVKEGATDLSDLAEAEFYEVSKFGWAVQKLENLDSDKYYEHTQSVSSDLWTINHNMSKVPAVTIFDDSGNNVEGQITVVDSNNITIGFNTAFSGVAHLN